MQHLEERSPGNLLPESFQTVARKLTQKRLMEVLASWLLESQTFQDPLIKEYTLNYIRIPNMNQSTSLN